MIGNIIIYSLIALTVLVSYICFQNKNIFLKFKFSPYRIKHNKEYYRFVYHLFVHADWPHLLINMFVFYSFAKVSFAFSSYHFKHPEVYILSLYFLGGFFSSIYSFIKHRNNIYYSAIGASGAVSAVVFSSIVFYPMGSIRLFLIPIDIPAYIFGGLYLIFSAVMAKKSKDNIGHDAHFGGALFGLFYPIIIKPSLVFDFFSFIINQ